MKVVVFFCFLLFSNFIFASNVSHSGLKKRDWGPVETAFGEVGSIVGKATDSYESVLNLLKLGSNILGPVGTIDGPEKVILEKLEQLEKAIMDAFKKLGEKMDMGFNEILHHIDRTDYRQTVIDEIRPLWEKFLILTKHPNMTDALHKFVKACDDHKPEEILGNMAERISIEPSILSSLKTVSFYDTQAFKSFSSSALQQMTQLQIVFGYCELIANNLTSINESSSTDLFEAKLTKIAKAVEVSEAELKDNFLQKGAYFVVHKCIDQYGVDGDKGTWCIVNEMKARYPWTNFNLCKERIGSACHADCAAKAKIDYIGDHKYIITDLSKINTCPTCLCEAFKCGWKDNNTFNAMEGDYLPYSNVVQETPRKSYPSSLHSKSYKTKSKRYRKRPLLRIEIPYSEVSYGESLIASFYINKK
uniref:Uncharacterized protein n=1 Tax=Panagrolaimus sp. ES5 TaxID=591445 RepID=A0AC34FK56_9BILA